MAKKESTTLDPKLVWERFVVPQRMKPGCTDEEKSWPAYITVDPNLPDAHDNMFEVKNQSSHDGNIINTYNLVWSVLEPLVFMRVISNNFKGRTDYNAVRYTIGHIEIECEFDATIIMGGKQERGNVETARLKVISYPYMQH